MAFDTEVRTEGVPMSDCFFVKLRTCLSVPAADSVCMRVALSVSFVKSSYFTAKIRSSIVEQNQLYYNKMFAEIDKTLILGMQQGKKEAMHTLRLSS